MLDWLKNINKEHPEFWKNYTKKFDFDSRRYVVLSTETSGLNPAKDHILSIGATTVENDNIIINDSYEVIMLQLNATQGPIFSSEFTVDNQQFEATEPEALESFINYLGNATIVGHRIDFDVEIINQALSKIYCGKLKNEALDIEVMYRKWKDISEDKSFSIDELRESFKIEPADRISAIDDAYTIALLFLKLKSRLGLK